MAWRAFQSRHLNGGEYDADSKVLTIQFVNGAVHKYFDVSPDKADTIFQISSPGSYLHAHIIGKHREMKMAHGSTKSGRRSQRKF